ncbi:hypothetical protein [Limibacterium fermenti]|uniref:hypothetical protein n=1 Tax=Limibacterium fermenti TaxID=3229863 RepID=UPI000E8F7F41|nr:hypothetical protein [Porphyromonadaceae bacterium]
MCKIYVASSWRNEIHNIVVQALQRWGHEVYDFKNPPSRTGFSWAHIDNKWQNWNTTQYREALNHPLAVAGFNSDFNAMKWADICIMVLSAHTEAGWMKGVGKVVYVVQFSTEQPELMYKIYDGIISSYDELTKMFS